MNLNASDDCGHIFGLDGSQRKDKILLDLSFPLLNLKLSKTIHQIKIFIFSLLL